MKYATTILVFSVAALLSLGLVMLYSSSMGHTDTRYPAMQAIWCGLGLVAAGVTVVMDYRHLKKFSVLLYIVSLVLLVTVLIHGVTKGGARRWLNLAGQSFQPSELAKVALVLILAHYGERFQRHMPSFNRGVVIPGLLIAPVLALVFLEPDWGTTVLLASVAGIMLLVAGARWRFLIPPVLVGVTSFVILLMNNPLRLKRFLSWWDPEATKDDIGYQAWQAMIALGSGGWSGLGLGNGRQKYGFVPEHHTDFIFSIIGEELGLIATVGVVIAFVVLVICGVCIAWNARDTFGLLLGTGVTFLIGLQAFINIGVVTSALPNKGLPLPFISRGGSNLFLMLVCVGILLSIARRAAESSREALRTVDLEELPIPQTT